VSDLSVNDVLHIAMGVGPMLLTTGIIFQKVCVALKELRDLSNAFYIHRDIMMAHKVRIETQLKLK
jgi:hypothetical protein